MIGAILKVIGLLTMACFVMVLIFVLNFREYTNQQTIWEKFVATITGAK